MQRILILLMRKLPYFLSKTRHLEASECTFHCSSYRGLCLALVFRGPVQLLDTTIVKATYIVARLKVLCLS